MVKALNGIFRITLVSNSYSKSDSLACLNWIQPVLCFIQLLFGKHMHSERDLGGINQGVPRPLLSCAAELPFILFLIL